MHWEFFCPGCDQRLQGRPGEEHTFSRCPACGAHFRTPGPPTPPPPPTSTISLQRLLGPGLVACLALILVAGWFGWKYWPRQRHRPRMRRAFRPDSGQMTVGPSKQPDEHRFALQRSTEPLQEVQVDEGPIRRLGDIGPVLAVAFAP